MEEVSLGVSEKIHLNYYVFQSNSVQSLDAVLCIGISVNLKEKCKGHAVTEKKFCS
jgi:hypothetical protein